MEEFFFFFPAQVQHGKINCAVMPREKHFNAWRKSNVSHSLFNVCSLLELRNFSTNKYHQNSWKLSNHSLVTKEVKRSIICDTIYYSYSHAGKIFSETHLENIAVNVNLICPLPLFTHHPSLYHGCPVESGLQSPESLLPPDTLRALWSIVRVISEKGEQGDTECLRMASS